MNRFGVCLLVLFACASTKAVAQDVVSMDNEPHYSLAFSNDYCRAYTVQLGRLETTKPVGYPHDWVRITLGGTFEQARNGTLFSKAGYDDPEGYYISFHFPADRITLRNPNNDPYSSVIVQIINSDDSVNRLGDPSLDPFSQMLGPGVDSHHSYLTTLTKTSVNIKSVQVVSGEAEEVRFPGVGSLLIAITDVDLQQEGKGAGSQDLQLSKGEIKWVTPGAMVMFKNTRKEPARFAVLEFR
jgi:hypothetical protein